MKEGVVKRRKAADDTGVARTAQARIAHIDMPSVRHAASR
jgi:hypothetical protein